jgi:hypothetical protein
MRAPMAALVLLALAAPAHSAPSDDFAAYCSRYSSYQTQLYCVNEEQAARTRIYSRTVAPEIWSYCVRYNSWTTVDYCINQEETAKRQLGR